MHFPAVNAKDKLSIFELSTTTLSRIHKNSVGTLRRGFALLLVLKD